MKNVKKLLQTAIATFAIALLLTNSLAIGQQLSSVRVTAQPFPRIDNYSGISTPNPTPNLEFSTIPLNDLMNQDLKIDIKQNQQINHKQIVTQPTSRHQSLTRTSK